MQVIKGTLIYADLATSFNKQSQPQILTLDFEDHNHIKYAQINHKLHTVKPSCQVALQPFKGTVDGMFKTHCSVI